MELKQHTGTSKNGREYTAYYVAIGKYRTPLFFPSEIELMYIKNQINKDARKSFQDDLLDELGELPHEN